MRPKFTFSEEVRVVRAIRNDGTVAGFAPGALLVRRGSTGFVRDWGVFLQDQIFSLNIFAVMIPGNSLNKDKEKVNFLWSEFPLE